MQAKLNNRVSKKKTHLGLYTLEMAVEQKIYDSLGKGLDVYGQLMDSTLI